MRTHDCQNRRLEGSGKPRPRTRDFLQLRAALKTISSFFSPLPRRTRINTSFASGFESQPVTLADLLEVSDLP